MVVGDILTFDVPPGHNVWQWQPESAVSEAEFNTCTFNATNGEIWATDSETKSFQIGSTDTMYFACEIGSHCLAGQKVCIYERQLITVYLHASNFAHIFARRSWCSPSCRRPLRRLRLNCTAPADLQQQQKEIDDLDGRLDDVGVAL